MNDPSLFSVTEIELVYRNKRDPRDRLAVRDGQSAYSVFLMAWDMNKIDLVEESKIILLDARGLCLGIAPISTGSWAQCIVDPKVVFAIALKAKASSLILAHNHPSGDVQPSRPDLALTEQLAQGGKFLSLRVLDHLVISRSAYYSFADNGLIP